MAILPQVFTVPTMVTGASITSAIEMPGVFLNMYLQVPTMTGGYGADTTLHIMGSGDNITFFRYANPESNTNTAGQNDFVIVSGCTQRLVYIPNFAFRWAKIETTAVATNGVTAQGQFKFVVVSNQ